MSSAASSPIPGAVPPPPRRRAFLALIGFITIPILVLDQLSKLYIRSHMMLYESIPVIRNFFDITFTQNAGAAFSMFTNLPPWFRGVFLFSLAIAAIVALLVLLAQSDRFTPTSIGFALILAGAGGNLIDRLVRGEVIDFLRVHYYGWNYPIFNVADSAITIGVTLILFAAFFRSDSD
ncbi:MAG TPA: signal peptidase II [Candidatus Binataceae bacterium]